MAAPEVEKKHLFGVCFFFVVVVVVVVVGVLLLPFLTNVSGGASYQGRMMCKIQQHVLGGNRGATARAKFWSKMNKLQQRDTILGGTHRQQ